MAVLGPCGVVLEVPDIAPGIKFYKDAGLQVDVEGNVARFSCPGQRTVCLTLVGGAERKRIHHLVLRADPRKFADVRRDVPRKGGRLIEPPAGFTDEGVWLEDPHGLRIRLLDAPAEQPLQPVETFTINSPGAIVRRNRSAMLAKSRSPAVKPLRLGHVLLFTPDVMRSVDFFANALGLGLADRAQEIVAFMCALRDSDHHIVAFAKSSASGFHHASFQVTTPDEVGRGARSLIERGNAGNWGVGRHTIGSNFFHYVQDPWGSWFEYYCDIDYISDYSRWQPTNYALEDSLENWGPPLPEDFVHNYEAAAAPPLSVE